LWEDPDGALANYLSEYQPRQRGETPPRRNCPTVDDVCQEFLGWKEGLIGSGELSRRTYRDYVRSCKLMGRLLGDNTPVNELSAFVFSKLRTALTKGRGPVALSNEIRLSRMVWKFAFDSGMIEAPIRFGSMFDMPSKKALREARNARGVRAFTAKQIRKLIEASSEPMRSMIRLAINCGYGNTDVGSICADHIRDGWASFPRPKTGVQRRCPLWPETVEGLPARKNGDLLFLTTHKRPWVHMSPNGAIHDNVSQRFKPLMKQCGVYRAGLGFYALRHSFETVAGGSKDQVAVSFLMGHVPHASDMSAVYREYIQDDRLVAVTNHVHDWLVNG
jgi:integrase